MHNISELFFNLIDWQLPGRQIAEQIKFAQSDVFFHLAFAKNARINSLHKYFSNKKIEKIFLSANLDGFNCNLSAITVEVLHKGFFHETNQDEQLKKCALIEGSVVIVNNNDVGQGEGMFSYAKFYNACHKTIFIAWDWDNHHWLDLSVFLAAHSDIYAPAHHENLYLLSRLNWLVIGPIYGASVQWSKQLLVDKLPEIICAERFSQPLGKHIPYNSFNFRNQVITTLSNHFASIGFSDRTFHVRSQDERLKEWYSYKSHWIVPVLNDVPIRIFDALITGGIPIVPASLRFLPPIQSISSEHILFYTPEDILNPKNIVARANALFDNGGRNKLVERHRYALEYHHGENRVREMLRYVNEIFIQP